MADVGERVAVFQADFEALEQPYADIREKRSAQAGLDTIQQVNASRKSNPSISEVERIAGKIASHDDEQLGPFDLWIARQTVRVGQFDKHAPTVADRKELLHTNLERIDHIQNRLGEGLTHVAVLGEYGSVDLYRSGGSENLVFEKIKAQYYENGHGGHSEASPAEEGIYVRFDTGTSVSVSHHDTTSEYSISKADVYRAPVMVEKKSSLLQIVGPSRVVNPALDPVTDSKLPFVALGSKDAPISSEALETIVATDRHRFGLRTAAYLGGLTTWLTLERPEENFRGRVLSDVSAEIALLLQKGADFDTFRRSVAASRGSGMRLRPQALPTRLADYDLRHIHAILHGAGVSSEDVKGKVFESIGKKPKTMRQITSQLAAKKAIDQFFDSF
jgi:hypothetical protein